MRIRSYTGRDFDTVLTLWNRALPHDPVTREQLIRKLLMDPDFTEKGFLLCEDGGEIIGFVNAVCRVLPAIPGQDDADTGFITAIAVTPGRDEHAVGGILLDAALPARGCSGRASPGPRTPCTAARGSAW